MKKVAFILLLGCQTVSADTIRDVGVRTANQILNGCNTDFIPGNCIFKAWTAYRVGKTAINIKSFEIKRSKRIKTMTKNNAGRLIKLTPQYRTFKKIEKVVK